jgi:hypothetical protein
MDGRANGLYKIIDVIEVDGNEIGDECRGEVGIAE